MGLILPAVVVVLVGVIALFYYSQGAFNAFMVLIFSVLAGTVAFELYEWLFRIGAAPFLPEFGHALCFAGLFVATLVLLQWLARQFIKGDVVLAPTLDHVLGAAFGFAIGVVTVGTGLLAAQMLPLPASLLGYQRVQLVRADTGEPLGEDLHRLAPSDVRIERSNLWLNPDGVAFRTAAALSAFTLSGQRPLRSIHPDLPEELFWQRAGVQPESRHVVDPDALSLTAAWFLDEPRMFLRTGTSKEPQWQEIRLPTQGRILVVRARFDSPGGVVDSDQTLRFTPAQVRVVGHVDSAWTQRPMCGFAESARGTPDQQKLRWVPLFYPITIRGLGSDEMDFAFDVPAGFQPFFVEFKRGARAEVTPAMLQKGRPEITRVSLAPAGAGGSLPTVWPAPAAWMARAAVVASLGAQGRVGARHPRKGEHKFSDELPVPLDARQLRQRNAELRTDPGDPNNLRFESGHVVLDWPEGAPPPGQAVARFYVPTGKRLFQLGVEPERAGSTLGQALAYARRTLGQFLVIDNRNRPYHRIGEIRIANVNGKRKIEIQYWPEAPIPERCIEPPNTVKESHLKGDYALIYLYLLPEDAEPVAFDSGRRRQPLR